MKYAVLQNAFAKIDSSIYCVYTKAVFVICISDVIHVVKMQKWSVSQFTC